MLSPGEDRGKTGGEDWGGREGGGLDEGGRAGRSREIAITLAGGCPDGETAPHSQGPAIDREPQLLMVRHKDPESVPGVLRRKPGGNSAAENRLFPGFKPLMMLPSMPVSFGPGLIGSGLHPTERSLNVHPSTLMFPIPLDIVHARRAAVAQPQRVVARSWNALNPKGVARPQIAAGALDGESD